MIGSWIVFELISSAALNSINATLPSTPASQPSPSAREACRAGCSTDRMSASRTPTFRSRRSSRSETPTTLTPAEQELTRVVGLVVLRIGRPALLLDRCPRYRPWHLCGTGPHDRLIRAASLSFGSAPVQAGSSLRPLSRESCYRIHRPGISPTDQTLWVLH